MKKARPSKSITALMPRDFRKLRESTHKVFAGNESTWQSKDDRWRLRRIRAVYSLRLPCPIWHVLRLVGGNRWNLVGRHKTLPAALRTLTALRNHERRVSA